MDRMFALELFDIAGRTSKVVHSYSALGGTLGWLESPIWSPNGQWIAFQTRGETTPRDLWVVNSDGNIGQRFGLATNPVWNPDSQHLAYVQWPPQSDSYLASSISFIEAPSWRIISSDLQAGGVPLAWTVTLPMP
jgi:Tol biopolymer transport system component